MICSIILYVVDLYFKIPFRVGEFLVFFYMGAAFKKLVEKYKNTRFPLYAIGLSVGAVVISLGIKVLSDHEGIKYLAILFFPVGIFVLLYLCGFELTKRQNGIAVVIDNIDRNSMGIYLFHEPFMYIVITVFVKYFNNAVLFAGVLIVSSMVWSLLLIKAINKLNLNFILGEYRS